MEYSNVNPYPTPAEILLIRIGVDRRIFPVHRITHYSSLEYPICFFHFSSAGLIRRIMQIIAEFLHLRDTYSGR